MKKYGIWILWILLLTLTSGCGSQNENSQLVQETFTISIEDQEIITEIMQDTLQSLYWRYLEDSVSFEDSTVPDKNHMHYEKILEASAYAGVSLEQFAGRQAVKADASLVHFNGDVAGTVHFYFVQNQLAALYYSAPYDYQTVYSLSYRNIFTVPITFSQYEDRAVERAYEQIAMRSLDGSFQSTGVSANGLFLGAILEQNTLKIYQYQNSFINLYNLTYKQLVPLSSTFTGSGLIVLYASVEYREGEEEEQAANYISETLVFYNQNFAIEKEVPLEAENYTCVYYDGENVILFRGTDMELYTPAFEIETEIYLGHTAIAITHGAIEPSGQNYYFITDGMDIYMYEKTDYGFQNIWQTHLSVDTVEGYICLADLNGDGVKELYLIDNTATAIRYILTEYGWITYNEDIQYNEIILPGDFNQNGRDDFIRLNPEDYSQTLYLSQN